MTVLILYDNVECTGELDERDTLDQVSAVKQILLALGHLVELLGFRGDVQSLKEVLLEKQPDLVFNLIETRSGDGSSIGVVPSVLESLCLAYTGCPSNTLYITSNKIIAKKFMKLAGIPTPDWMTPREIQNGIKGSDFPSTVRWCAPYIIKSIWEHASIGLDERSIVYPKDQEELLSILDRRNQNGPGLFFAERYIEGREFNLSLLEVDGTVQVLPPAEMQFCESRPNHPNILTYRAKWDRESPEYKKSKRCFKFGVSDRHLLDQLKKLALQAWECFDLNGYARVDFRVEENDFFVLEINANPCIATDSGFVAAAAEANIVYRKMIEHIVAHPVTFY